MFMSNMSHDIRTPMNAIIGMTAIAGANINDRNRVLDCLSKINHFSRHPLSLINEVLDMSQIERGGISLVQEEFHLPEIIDDLLTIMKPGIEQHRHDISVTLTDIFHENVTGDRMRIQQVLVNIMTNAVKYTSDGGKIHLGITEKFTHGSTSCYEFIVEDNGIGMSEDFLKVIFEPFIRADDDRTSKILGTGFGMAITKNIVEMMNGTVKVDSRPGEGTRFTVTIVLRICDDDSIACDELADLSVLVVDDDKECCEGTVAILDDIGMSGAGVDSAENGKEAVDIIKEKGPDYYGIVFMDIQMPVMNGYDAAREIRELPGCG